MRNIWIIFKREMMAYFFSPIAYIVAAAFLFVMGISFSVILGILSESSSDFRPMDFFFNGMFTWIALLVVSPVITMRLFADEKRTGTIESLMTAPLRDIEYVLGKFLSAYAFFVLLWAPTANAIFVLRHFSKDHTALDFGAILGGYLGLALVGMVFIAIGCMASACTRNQIVAAVVAFSLTCALFLAGMSFYLNIAEKHREFCESISIIVHMQEFSRGGVDWRRVVFYLTSTGFLLFVTHRIVQSRQWRS